MLGAVPEAARLTSGEFGGSWRGELSYSWSEDIRILELTLDPLFAFEARSESLIDGARLRHGYLATVASSNYGLDTGVLRATRNALLAGLTRYGFVTTRYRVRGQALRVLETRDTNVAARRVVGRGMSARLETRLAWGCQIARGGTPLCA